MSFLSGWRAAMRRGWRAGRELLGPSLWAAPPPDASRARRVILRVVRLGYFTIGALVGGRINLRAAALTYYSVLSLVPLLAFAFSVLKGLGAYDLFVKTIIAPYVHATFGENPFLVRAFDQVLGFVARTSFSSLGVAGLVLLLYTTIRMLSNIESALNAIFGVAQGRSAYRQVTDYITMTVITPVLILLAVAMGGAAQSSSVVHFLRESLDLGPVIDFALRLSSVVIACTALLVLYLVMPNEHVRFVSALLGATVAGIAWQSMLALQINAQSTVARYNAIYAGFAAIPIFLLWVYVSWLVVLVGAELAAAHQHERRLMQQRRGEDADQVRREKLALALAARVTHDFDTGTRSRTAGQLAAELNAPALLVERIAEALVGKGVLARVVAQPEQGLMPGRNPETIRVNDVLRALRTATSAAPADDTSVTPAVEEVFHALESEQARSPANVTLRELAERLGQA